MATYYARATATGANDGSSWADAFTSLSSASSAIDTGDTLLLDGTFRDALPQIASKDNVTVDGGQGPSGSTMFLGERKVEESDLTDETGGVWSFALASAPPTVTWDYKQDSTAGAITGVSTEADEIVDAFDGVLADRPSVQAFYGHLARSSTFTTTTPAEGFWSYASGRVYFNPPGSPAVAEVAEKIGYGSSDRGVYFQGCDDVTVRNLTVAGFGNPSGQRGSYYFAGCRNVTLEDCVSYDAGYRAFNIEGATGDTASLGHRVRRCVAAGDTIIGLTENYPFVVYNTQGSSDADALLEDCAIIAYPWLTTTGRPMLGSTSGQTPFSQAYKPAGFYTHAGGSGATITGITLRRFVFLSMCQELNKKHHADSALGMFWASERVGLAPLTDTPAFTAGVWENYPVKIDGGLVYGTPGSHGNVSMRRVRILVPRPRGGLSNYYAASTGINSWVLANTSGAYSFYYQSCEMLFRRKNNGSGGIWQHLGSSNGTYIDSSLVVYDLDMGSGGFDTDCFVRNAASSTVRGIGSVFVSTGSGTGNGAIGGGHRHFMRLNGSSGSGDYPTGSYGGLDFEGCWFFGFASGDTFYRGATAIGANKGRTFAEFIDGVLGPLNQEGVCVENLTTDPEFRDFVTYTTGVAGNDIRPEADGNLDTLLMDPPLAALSGVLGIAGNSYDGLYGAYYGDIENDSTQPVPRRRRRLTGGSAATFRVRIT